MTERKFTDEEVIKALECCANTLDCNNCSLIDEDSCTCKDINCVLDLVNRQRAEIERLQKKTVSKSKKNVNFKTGDYAKIANNVSGHEFKIGTIVKLEKCNDDYKAFANGDYWWVVDDDLVKVDILAKRNDGGRGMTGKERDELRKNAYASLDQAISEQAMQFYANFCEEFNSNEKPPLGLVPPGIVYDLCMREISEAILRYLDPERTIGKEDYGRIAKWAEELHEVALLMVKLLK